VHAPLKRAVKTPPGLKKFKEFGLEGALTCLGPALHVIVRNEIKKTVLYQNHVGLYLRQYDVTMHFTGTSDPLASCV
jgi:hypothetical protein